MDELERGLRVIDPGVDLDGVGPLARAVGIEVVSASARRRRSVSRRVADRLRGSRRRAAVFGAALVLVPAVAVAGVLHFQAETGVYGNLEGTGTQQAINMCATDVNAYMQTLIPSGQPLPPGTTWGQLINDIVEEARKLPDGCGHGGRGLQEGSAGLAVRLIRAPACSWERWVVQASPSEQALDLPRADAALAQIPVAAQQAHPGFDSAWKQEHALYVNASLAFVTNAYRAYCTHNPVGPEAFMRTSQVQEAAGQ